MIMAFYAIFDQLQNAIDLSPCEVLTQQERSNLEVLLKVRRAMEEAIVSYHDFISKIYVITQILINYSSLEIIELSIVEFD